MAPLARGGLFLFAGCAFFWGDARGLGKECAALAGRAVHAHGTRSLGKTSVALAGCAVHARGARSLEVKTRGFGRRLNRAIPIGMTFGFWFLRLLVRLRRRGLAGWPPRARGAFLFAGRAFFGGRRAGFEEGKRGACRLRGTCAWRAEFGGECAGTRSPIKSGDPDWGDVRLLVLALACAA